jgi:hypothetical protein
MGKHVGHWKDCRGYYRIGNKDYEHRVFMTKYIGRELKKKEIVHHWDLNLINNIQSNLALFRHQAAHKRLHAFCRRNDIQVVNLYFNQSWLY